MKITTHLDYVSHCKTALVQIGRVDEHIEYFRKILAAIKSIQDSQRAVLENEGGFGWVFCTRETWPKSAQNPFIL